MPLSVRDWDSSPFPRNLTPSWVVPRLVKLAAVLCALIGVVQIALSHNPFGIVWIVASAVLFGIDRFYGD